jgi:hypothetical protein
MKASALVAPFLYTLKARAGDRTYNVTLCSSIVSFRSFPRRLGKLLILLQVSASRSSTTPPSLPCASFKSTTTAPQPQPHLLSPSPPPPPSSPLHPHRGSHNHPKRHIHRLPPRCPRLAPQRLDRACGRCACVCLGAGGGVSVPPVERWEARGGDRRAEREGAAGVAL